MILSNPKYKKSASNLAKGFAVFPHGALHQDLSWEKGLPEGHGQANHRSYSLNSLKGGYIEDNIWATIGGIKGDTRSLDSSLYACCLNCGPQFGACLVQGHTILEILT